ncbi:glycoside hydrolase family 1 protein [Marinilabilia rubra]|uniref:Beta-glucosidase n=1 Tax=Marinilabilia rubra TaxID=2162893 RepID=A0A2U2BCP3_9BACT|nr:family 1 glycosylhydrolase [Marinilabilia rubra]PWE00846.1 beta-glucosidase [Marinilabilia rubra]
MLKKKDFGKDFKWGVTISAFQNEGAAFEDGKSASIWDTFTSDSENVNDGESPGSTSDFYHNYKKDIKRARKLGFKVFRFSLSWPRIIPDGKGEPNPLGIDFYNRVIDTCLKQSLEPWVTIYHWDLPQVLEDEGGWTNREILQWFSNYVEVVTSAFGDRVKHWIVMNEPMTFVGLGYFTGYHAPGRNGIGNFMKAAHHATLCMAEGGRIVKRNVGDAEVGVALSCSYVRPVNKILFNRRAARRVEGLLNRFFIEPLLGLGYPTDIIPALNIIKSNFQPGDEERLAFDFDFIGLQYYFRVVAKFSLFPPVLFATEVPPWSRKTKLNSMGLDVYPKGLSSLLNFYSKYDSIRKIILTESGVCYPDFLRGDKVNDARRKKYHQKMLKQVKKAIKRDIPVGGYFVWTLVDNFEWREGFKPRFGLVYNDFKTQKRTVKASGKWFKKFLRED